ncbi:hypothetical protein [Sporocytophaga myxococcoides]|uniref:hypothetical protein n=1 Tax=Sporocytophaga myxococcoides TaxID=153721 RepID=UPI000403763E|nr:hypothetical protein [Sporocytophaga myxococcoides]
MKHQHFIIVLILLTLWSCSSSKKATIPLSETVLADDTYTIIWNGVSHAYRYENKTWIRDEQYDYQFDVIQKRYDNLWKSIKSLHRIHPEYDGKAGDRDQTMYFELAYNSLNDSNKVISTIISTLGDGTGLCDPEFRNSQLIMYVKEPSSFLPYNKFRITQHYNYEEGLLTETVELLNEKDGIETPFMKNEETAWFYIKGKLDKAPTIFR